MTLWDTNITEVFAASSRKMEIHYWEQNINHLLVTVSPVGLHDKLTKLIKNMSLKS